MMGKKKKYKYAICVQSYVVLHKNENHTQIQKHGTSYYLSIILLDQLYINSQPRKMFVILCALLYIYIYIYIRAFPVLSWDLRDKKICSKFIDICCNITQLINLILCYFNVLSTHRKINCTYISRTSLIPRNNIFIKLNETKDFFRKRI